jgi:hypothetical protein
MVTFVQRLTLRVHLTLTILSGWSCRHCLLEPSLAHVMRYRTGPSNPLLSLALGGRGAGSVPSLPFPTYYVIPIVVSRTV